MSYPTDLNDMSEDVCKWHVEKTGIEGKATRAMARKLLEEAAEFFNNPTPEEAADVLICLLNIAGREDWNFQQAYWNKMQVLRQRTDQVERDRDRLLCEGKEAAK